MDVIEKKQECEEADDEEEFDEEEEEAGDCELGVLLYHISRHFA